VFLYGISLQLFLRRKDPDAGSESGMTGRKKDCHPVSRGACPDEPVLKCSYSGLLFRVIP
jgi:hypothetical protein